MGRTLGGQVFDLRDGGSEFQAESRRAGCAVLAREVEHQLADVDARFHDTMGLGRLFERKDLVNDGAGTAGVQRRPDALAQIPGNRRFLGRGSRAHR